MIKWRWQWIELVELAKRRKKKLFKSLMDLPDDLPDLSRPTPSSNSRKKGIKESWFARRMEE